MLTSKISFCILNTAFSKFILQEEIKDLVERKLKVTNDKDQKWEEDRSKWQNIRQKKDSVEGINDEVQK